MNIAGVIPRVGPLSPNTFFKEYLAKNRPVILTGAMCSWKALDKWRLAYLKKAFGSKSFRVYISPDGAFRAHPTRGFHESLWKNISAQEFIDWIEAGERPPHLLLQHQSLITNLRELAQDVQVPPYVQVHKLRDVNFWIGAGDNVTPLHCDQAENLLAQVVGEKRVLLAAPNQRANLYPFMPFSRIPPVTSRVNIAGGDGSRFPRFANASFIEAKLQAGEMLFVPVHWWHEIRGIGLNISVNFWWEPSLRMLWRYPAYMLNTLLYNSLRVARAQLKLY